MVVTPFWRRLSAVVETFSREPPLALASERESSWAAFARERAGGMVKACQVPEEGVGSCSPRWGNGRVELDDAGGTDGERDCRLKVSIRRGYGERRKT